MMEKIYCYILNHTTDIFVIGCETQDEYRYHAEERWVRTGS